MLSKCSQQVRIQDFEKKVGGGGLRVTVLKYGVSCACAQRFFPPLYEVWGSPRRGGGEGRGVLTAKTPWIRPCSLNVVSYLSLHARINM